ncbi:MAG TPA: hypothetical protein VM888_13365 [Chitinophagaceae bacterium]|nr:hypothetical protein [Chitinophagaceae bacterium]
MEHFYFANAKGELVKPSSVEALRKKFSNVASSQNGKNKIPHPDLTTVKMQLESILRKLS